MTTSGSDQPSGLVLARCPACRQTTGLHPESVYLGAEVLCHVCAAVLRVEATGPLRVIEVTDEDP